MKKQPTDLLVIGGGPGGYAAAFYAADRGKSVLLVEEKKRLGGVCLNEGCIPSKALLHATEPIRALSLSKQRGITFGKPRVNLQKFRAWKEQVIENLGSGLAQLAKQRGIERLRGRAHFEGSDTVRVESEDGQHFYSYRHAILAVGSQPVLPAAFDLGSHRVMTSKEALKLREVPETLLVVGGGYIGLELGTVYAALGSRVTLVEALDRILMGADRDLVKPVQRYVEQAFAEIYLKTKVVKMATRSNKIQVVLDHEGRVKEEAFDRVLVAIGRKAQHQDIGLENTKVSLHENGFVQVDGEQRTEDPRIFAIGDVAGGPLLAHKAFQEARIAVDAILGETRSLSRSVVPAVIFTDPEIAWCGLTEQEAREKGSSVKVTRIPWAALGRALTQDRTDGLTKLLFDSRSQRLLGVGMAGPSASELIAEGVLALEMGATALDLSLSIHPHPTLSEGMKEAADSFLGFATHLHRKR